MRKLLFLLSVAFSMSVAAQMAPTCFDNTLGCRNGRGANKATSQKSVSRAADDGFTIQFCDDVYSWYNLTSQSNVTYKCYIYITPEMATTVAGNKVTEVMFSSATKSTRAIKGTVFVTESLDGTPTTSTKCDVENSSLKSDGYQTVALETPYTIKENTGFYFGYTVEKCGSSDYPIAFDGLAPNGFSGMVDWYSSLGSLLGNCDLGEQIGTNIFLKAKTVGEAKGFANLFQFGSLSFGDFTLPVVEKSALGQLQLDVRNIGINPLTSIEYSIVHNGVEGEVATQDVNVPEGASRVIGFPLPAIPEGKNSFTLNIKKLNGVDAAKSSSDYCIVLPNSGYERKFVVEEGTGTWCGWCPRGIVGLDKMSELYPDKFIGIAVHSGDLFEVSSYTPFISAYFSGFPRCIINRDPIYSVDPNFENLNYYYSNGDYWAGQRGVAKVDLQVASQGDKLGVTANTTFAFSESNAKYKLAFVILEDGLTSVQSNAYAGGGNGAMDGWESKGSSVPWTYQHTARGIFDAFGIENSVPATIVADETMTYSTTIPIANIKDVAQTEVVALILDSETGTILNAAKVAAKDYGEDTGIREVPNANALAECYDLSGMRVGSPAKGSLVIRRQGDKVCKMIAR